MSNEITKIQPNDLFWDPQKFEQLKEVAKTLRSSPIVPKHIRGDSEQEGIANIIITMALANELRENFISLMQYIYIRDGKAGWASQYLIGRANSGKVFQTDIDWRVEVKGEVEVTHKVRVGWDAAQNKPKYEERREKVPNISVTAFATSKTGKEISFTCDMVMAEKEKWTASEKYHTVPELMLRYRSGTFLVRLYAPQVMQGYSTAEELETNQDTTLVVTQENRFRQLQPAPTTPAPTTGIAAIDAIANQCRDLIAKGKTSGDFPAEMVDTFSARVDALEKDGDEPNLRSTLNYLNALDVHNTKAQPATSTGNPSWMKESE